MPSMERTWRRKTPNDYRTTREDAGLVLALASANKRIRIGGEMEIHRSRAVAKRSMPIASLLPRFRRMGMLSGIGLLVAQEGPFEGDTTSAYGVHSNLVPEMPEILAAFVPLA